MRYQAVIFDLDGVICHTDQYHFLAWKKIADKIGVPFDKNINNRLRGVGRAQSLDIILEAGSRVLSESEKHEYLIEKNKLYREYLTQMSPEDVEPEVMKTLNEIKVRGIKSAIGSSSKNARFILEQIGLIDWFDAIVDGSNISRSKPDPEVFVTAARLLNIKPEYCLVVEDALSGIKAAAAAGMDSAAVGSAALCHAATYDLEGFASLNDVLLYH